MFHSVVPSIDILINNAGLTVGKYQLTVDGHEMTWGTNHLGMFILKASLFDGQGNNTSECRGGRK